MCQISLQKKKKKFLEKKLTKCISKPKDLWKTLKSIGLLDKSDG